MRTATITRAPSTTGGTFGDLVSDSGFTCKTVEKPWDADLTDESCVDDGSGLCIWQFSEKHGRYLYHYQGDPKRTMVEIHGANVAEQLLGCLAPGETITMFGKDSIRPGVPAFNHFGVTASDATLEKLHADFLDPATGQQVPFMLTVKWK